MRILLLLLATVAVSTAGGQVLVSPSFYLSSAPEVPVGGSIDSELTRASGQNFKDGSRVEVVVVRPEPGTRLEVRVASDAFDAYLSVFGPDGELIDTNDDGPDGLDPQLAFTPEQDGTYLLVVSGVGPYDVGAYSVSARVAETPEVVPLPLPGTLDAELAGTEPADPDVGHGPTRSFRFELDEASLVRIQASSSAFDTVLALFDEEGWLDQNDDAEGTTDSELLVELDPGAYRVAVAAYDVGAGPFRVTTERYVRAD